MQSTWPAFLVLELGRSQGCILWESLGASFLEEDTFCFLITSFSDVLFGTVFLKLLLVTPVETCLLVASINAFLYEDVVRITEEPHFLALRVFPLCRTFGIRIICFGDTTKWDETPSDFAGPDESVVACGADEPVVACGADERTLMLQQMSLLLILEQIS